MLYQDKLNDLFFSTDIKNRTLAFELAKSDGSYETFINALFVEFQDCVVSNECPRVCL